jgi:predicted nucleic acid-binding protein
MKDLFPGYYPMSADEEAEFWSSCLFVFDTNVLLNLYRMKLDDRKRSLKLFRELGDRLWIPHQVAAEYQRNRLGVVREQIARIDDLSKKISEAEKMIRNASPDQHPLSGVDADQEEACKACQRVERFLKSKRDTHEKLLKDDRVREELDKVLTGRVGPPYDTEDLVKIIADGERRYGALLPPGFADNRKRGIYAFGDWIIWRQMLDKAKTERRPMLLVTDDRRKEDWYVAGAPAEFWTRDELVTEMQQNAGAAFRLYTSEEFLKKASEHLERRTASVAERLSGSGAWTSYLELVRRAQDVAALMPDWLPSAGQAAAQAVAYLRNNPWLTQTALRVLQDAEIIGRVYSDALRLTSLQFPYQPQAEPLENTDKETEGET